MIFLEKGEGVGQKIQVGVSNIRLWDFCRENGVSERKYNRVDGSWILDVIDKEIAMDHTPVGLFAFSNIS